jgi:hypothetical protein
LIVKNKGEHDWEDFLELRITYEIRARNSKPLSGLKFSMGAKEYPAENTCPEA